jgi:hypothetical protein
VGHTAGWLVPHHLAVDGGADRTFKPVLIANKHLEALKVYKMTTLKRDNIFGIDRHEFIKE